jgi:hypothetical protein
LQRCDILLQLCKELSVILQQNPKDPADKELSQDLPQVLQACSFSASDPLLPNLQGKQLPNGPARLPLCKTGFITSQPLHPTHSQ